MKINVLNIQGQETGRQVDLPEHIFGIEPNEHAVWLDVKQYLANQRQGTHKSKERGEVAGSTRKLHRQKGTGGSRKGDIKNPIFRGGGRVFGPRPRNYRFKLNKKLKQLARFSALSSKVSSGEVMVVEDFSFDAPKTRAFKDIVSGLDLSSKKSLFVTSGMESELVKSSGNLPRTNVMRAQDLNTYAVLNNGTIVLCEGAVQTINETFSK